MRSHLNVGEVEDLPIIEAILDVCRQMQPHISVALVALGEAGFSVESDALMEQSLALGLDYVGGVPSLTPDPKANIDITFAMAERLGKPIDLHVDETEDPNMLALEYLADKTIATGMQGQVTAGHCCSLTFVDSETAARVMDKVAEAQITIVTLPSCNLVLMGRGMSPPPRGVTPVKALLERGVNVCAGSDNVRDPFNPFGAYDLLHIANLNAHVAHLTGEAELYTSLAMVSRNPARAFGDELPTEIAIGQAADLVVVEAQSVLDTVLYPPARLATFKAGRLVVKTTIQQEWYQA
jgi:cytosine deaminase